MSFHVQYPPPYNPQGSSSYHPSFNGFVPRPPPPPSATSTFYPPPPPPPHQVYHPQPPKPQFQPQPQASSSSSSIPQPTSSSSKSTLYPSRPHPTPSYNSPRLLSRSRPSNTSTAPGVTFIASIVLPDSVKHTFTLWQEEEEEEEEEEVAEKVVGLSNGAEKLSFGVTESSSGKGKGGEVEEEVAQPPSIEEKKESAVVEESKLSVPALVPAPALSTAVPAASPPPPPPSPPPPPPPVSLPPKSTPAPQPSPPTPASVSAPSPPATIPSSSPAPLSPSTPKSTVVVPSPSTTDAPSSPPPAPAVPAPAPPPPVKKAPTSWASLLRPPPSANPPPAFQTAVNGSASSKSKPNGVGKKVKPSSLAQLLSVGAAPGEGGPVMDTTARGLVNRGNLCFVNSILQVLVFTPGFYTLFMLLGEMLSADLKGDYPLVDAMILFLREFPPSSSASSSASASQFPAPPTAAASSTSSSSASTPTGSNGASKTLGGGPADAFVPEGIYTALTHIPCFSFMRQGHQEDAEEFLGFFLNTLHEEIGSLLNREGGRIGGAVSAAVNGAAGGGWGEEGEEGVRVVAAGGGGSGNGGDDGWMEVGKKNKSSLLRTTESRPNSITHLFTGLLRSTLLLPSPAKPSITIEPFSPLQLDIQPPHIHSIEAALLHLTSPEVIHGVTLPGGRGEGEASKRCELERMPRVLMLHLKRFGWDMSGSGKARKMGKAVGFGEELIIPRDAIAATRRTPEPIRYKLFGVVYHHGPTVSSGHYTSAVLAQATKTWLHVDDETVTTVEAKEVCVTEQAAKEGNAGDIGGRERCAYLLFYERVE